MAKLVASKAWPAPPAGLLEFCNACSCLAETTEDEPIYTSYMEPMAHPSRDGHYGWVIPCPRENCPGTLTFLFFYGGTFEGFVREVKAHG